MTAWARISCVAESHARDLARRRMVVGMLVVLPAVMYLSVLGEEARIPPGENPFTLRVGIIGVAWAVGGAAFFLGLASRRVDERLILAGYRPEDLAFGRLGFLAALALPIAGIYGALIVTLSRGDAGPVLLAVVTTSVVALALGLAISVVLPRELEGVLALVAVNGIQTSIPAGSAIGPALPFYGPTRLVDIAWGSSGSLLAPLLHAAVAVTVLSVTFIVLWRRRLAA